MFNQICNKLLEQQMLSMNKAEITGKEAIESYLINSVKDMARIVTKSKTRDAKQKKKYNDMVSTWFPLMF